MTFADLVNYLPFALACSGLMAYVLCLRTERDGRRVGRLEIMASAMGLLQIPTLVSQESDRSELLAASFLIFVFSAVILKQVFDWRRAQAGIFQQS